MIVTKPTLSALQHLEKWATTRDLADASKLSIQAARKRIFRLIEAGLVESREAHDNPKGLNEFRITTEGAKSLEAFNEQVSSVDQSPHDFKPRTEAPGHFAWLDLCANERPNYNDNNRYIPTDAASKHMRHYQI
jgi:DNA-binding transcriptional MocR family regulator